MACIKGLSLIYKVRFKLIPIDFVRARAGGPMKERVEDHVSIDIRALAPALKPGQDIRAELSSDTLKIDLYVYTDGKATAQRIELVYQTPPHWHLYFDVTTTDCNYGGVRYWFKCPACDKRKGKIYRIGEHWQCRTCADLTYDSCNESRMPSKFRRVVHLWNEEARLDREYRRVYSQDRKQTHYKGKLIKRLQERF